MGTLGEGGGMNRPIRAQDRYPLARPGDLEMLGAELETVHGRDGQHRVLRSNVLDEAVALRGACVSVRHHLDTFQSAEGREQPIEPCVVDV